MGNIVEPSTDEVSEKGTQIPKITKDDLSDFVKCNSVELWRNQLKSLPSDCTSMKNLKHLSIKYNDLKSIPTSLLSLPSLEFLEIGFNCLERFSLNDITSPKLKELNLICDNLAEIGFNRGGRLPTSLTSLNLSGNKLQAFPPELFSTQSKNCLPNLQTLNISNNHVALSPTFFPFSQLKSLNMSFNQLTQIQKNAFDALTNLDTLDLRYNKLTKLPPDLFANLGKLSILKMDGNDLIDLPESLLQLKNLTELHVSQNKLKVWGGDFKKLKHLRVLNLADNQLANIIMPQGNLPALESLDLNNNEIRSITALPLASFTSLKFLYLDSNHIQSIDLKNLPSKCLYFLKLSQNEITSITGDFAAFTTLSILDISNNPYLSQLNHSITSLALTEFYANQIGLKEVPAFFSAGRLNQTLETLCFSNNYLQFINPITNFQKLQKLDLSFNEIGHLPQSFLQLKSLTSLYLQGNRGLCSLTDANGNPLQSFSRSSSISEGLDDFDLLEVDTEQKKPTNKIHPLMLIPSSVLQLDVDSTDLQEIPNPWISLHPKLEIFVAAHNHLQTLPNSLFAHLAKKDTCAIELLDFSFNNLSSDAILQPLQPVAKSLNSLKMLDLSGNPCCADARQLEILRNCIKGIDDPKNYVAQRNTTNPLSLAKLVPIFDVQPYPPSFTNRLPMKARTLYIPKTVCVDNHFQIRQSEFSAYSETIGPRPTQEDAIGFIPFLFCSCEPTKVTTVETTLETTGQLLSVTLTSQYPETADTTADQPTHATSIVLPVPPYTLTPAEFMTADRVKSSSPYNLWCKLFMSRDIPSLISTALSILAFEAPDPGMGSSTHKSPMPLFGNHLPMWVISIVLFWANTNVQQTTELGKYIKIMEMVLKQEGGKAKACTTQQLLTGELSSPSLGLYAVFDGHGGHQTSEHLGNLLLPCFTQAIFDVLFCIVARQNEKWASSSPKVGGGKIPPPAPAPSPSTAPVTAPNPKKDDSDDEDEFHFSDDEGDVKAHEPATPAAKTGTPPQRGSSPSAADGEMPYPTLNEKSAPVSILYKFLKQDMPQIALKNKASQLERQQTVLAPTLPDLCDFTMPVTVTQIIMSHTVRLLAHCIRKLNPKGGSTGLVLLLSQTRVFTANVGDCRAILIREMGLKDGSLPSPSNEGDSPAPNLESKQLLLPFPLTFDQKLTNHREIERLILHSNKFIHTPLSVYTEEGIEKNTPYYAFISPNLRLCGQLAVARSFGDFTVGYNGVGNLEEVRELTIDGKWKRVIDQSTDERNSVWRGKDETIDLSSNRRLSHRKSFTTLEQVVRPSMMESSMPPAQRELLHKQFMERQKAQYKPVDGTDRFLFDPIVDLRPSRSNQNIGHLAADSAPMINTKDGRWIERTKRDVCIVMACDGLWDVLDNYTVADAIALSMQRTPQHEGILPQVDASDAASRLRALAVANKTDDNVTVMVLSL
ncbi:putative Leucine-rich repeat protein SHOC-2 [Blattamonas nauphoetae]|uniref:Leucine-rich repeat protein SHOC-2 n=1 Tax=Blattamonas nauphoetae TaxID=2049346 RepID=A0ABQ9YGC1_9EUKA|nr:putative Leucine-rich repeat protein SHOC-2 [Blattamonas nauphoetae]